MEILKFYRDDCGPCKMVDSYLQMKNATYTSINAEEEREVAEKYGVIFSVPVVLLVDGDEIIQRSGGFVPPELERILAAYEESKE